MQSSDALGGKSIKLCCKQQRTEILEVWEQGAEWGNGWTKR